MFYIIEKKEQLDLLGPFDDCFVRLIPKNKYYHPSLTTLSLIYIKPISGEKGYILCLDHNEAFGLDQHILFNWLDTKTNRLFILDKKEAMYWLPDHSKLFDLNFIEPVNLSELKNNNCINYYYRQYPSLHNTGCLIPISKHYEESEEIYNLSKNSIRLFGPTSTEDWCFWFNNNRAVPMFYQLEKSGLKLDKTRFIEYYGSTLIHPEFNLNRGKIFTQYNLHTTTTRPSNAFNGINFSAINKDSGERECYIPEYDMFVELDIQGYHPRLIAELIGFEFPEGKNTYEVLGDILGVTQEKAKELTFKQIYGGVWQEYSNKPFFKDIITYVEGVWDEFQYQDKIYFDNKTFRICDLKDITPYKLFNYIIQSKETSNNVVLLEKVLDYLKDKKTKIVLYVYDSILLDYSREDGNILQDIVDILKYPLNIKHGLSYNSLEKL